MVPDQIATLPTRVFPKNIDGVKYQFMKLNDEMGTANGKLSILESFVKSIHRSQAGRKA